MYKNQEKVYKQYLSELNKDNNFLKNMENELNKLNNELSKLNKK